MMKKVLHIAPHIGGGVGQVLGNIAANSRKYSDFEHQIICLEQLGKESRNNAETYSLDVKEGGLLDIKQCISEAEIIQIDWWNHPLLFKFLCSYQLPPARLVIYSHISGFYPPNVLSQEIIDYTDVFVTSTKYTLEHPIIRNLPENVRKAKIKAIHSCSGLSRVRNVQKTSHKKFNIGFLGTLNFCKLHPEFVKMSMEADIPNVNFIICGDGDSTEIIKQQVKKWGCEDIFEFKGYVNDIATILGTFDIFGYPLTPSHYGTGEQVLIEAMGAGIPPVVLNNGAEKCIIMHGVTGMVASSPKEYSEILAYLYRNPNKVKMMSENAKHYASSNFEISHIIKEFESVYNELLCRPKTIRKVLDPHLQNSKHDGCKYFITSQGNYAKEYVVSASFTKIDSLFEADRKIAALGANMLSQTKGSVIHYLSYFPEDPYLYFWSGLLLQKQGEHEEAINSFHNAAFYGFKHPRVDWYILYSSFILGTNENYEILISHIPNDLLDAIGRFPNEFKGENTSKILEVINGVRSKKCGIYQKDV